MVEVAAVPGQQDPVILLPLHLHHSLSGGRAAMLSTCVTPSACRPAGPARTATCRIRPGKYMAGTRAMEAASAEQGRAAEGGRGRLCGAVPRPRPAPNTRYLGRLQFSTSVFSSPVSRTCQHFNK